MALARSDRPDVIILDICMPRHPGRYILRDLKSNPATHDIPVIILTSMGTRLGVSFSTEDLCSLLGLEHLGRATAPSMDALLAVVTSSPWSVETAHRIKTLARANARNAVCPAIARVAPGGG